MSAAMYRRHAQALQDAREAIMEAFGGDILSLMQQSEYLGQVGPGDTWHWPDDLPSEPVEFWRLLQMLEVMEGRAEAKLADEEDRLRVREHPSRQVCGGPAESVT